VSRQAHNPFVSRVRFLTLLCAAVALVIIGRLYTLQIMHGHDYALRANSQFAEPSDPLVDRGTVYFSDKENNLITAASIKEGFSIAVNPSKVKDAEALYKAISPLVPLDHDQFVAKATKQGSQYQLVASHLDSDTGQKLEALILPGLIVQNDRWRFYPGQTLAAQEIGFVAYNGDVQEGRYGLERYYNDTLMKPKSDLYGNFFVQLFGGVKSVVNGDTQQGDVVTTIEPTVQAELERQLAIYNQSWRPQLQGGIIMNPQNGEIYAMAVYPTFDLNAFNVERNPLIYANPLVQNVYEMGSIIKPLTMAAGIDSGAITASSTYYDTGCITVNTKQICNYDLKARGTIPMQQVLSQSLNVGASWVATQMGQVIQRNYFLNHYALASTTGVDLPGEVSGLTAPLHTPYQVNYDTAAFGQGIAITPMETIRALATLANGGYLVTPHLTKQIRYNTGITQTLNWPKTGPVLKESTSLAVTRMLSNVVDTVLANGEIHLDHYTIAAKTGTGQIVDPTTGKYYPDRYLHSYFGYLPSYDARFIILLFAYEPVGAPYASETWSDTFHSLTQFLINYYNVPPDR
jgi:stage V sporulation protein D (sporulation-specific penicillin-binding protein)